MIGISHIRKLILKIGKILKKKITFVYLDNEIYLFLTQKTKLPTKYKTFLEKNINEK